MIKSFLQGRFMNHPLHPLLVHLPVGLWVVSFIFDICFLVSANGVFAQASWYCMLIGLIGAGVSAIAGYAEYVDIPRNSLPRRVATTHMVLNLGVTALFLIDLLLRYGRAGAVPTLVTRGQFFLSLVTIFILSVSGYLGGLLVYNYGIGFKPQLRDKPRDDIRRAA
jgi:uncharacterized membrane protein